MDLVTLAMAAAMGGGGSGGGSSGGGVLVVQFTYDPDTGNLVGDKTCKEVWDAYIAGSCVLFKIYSDNDYAKPVHGRIESGTYSFYIYNPNSGSYTEAMGEANDNIYAYLGD